MQQGLGSFIFVSLSDCVPAGRGLGAARASAPSSLGVRSQLHFSAAEDELILYVHSELGAADRITAEAIDKLLLRCSPALRACP